MPKHKPLLIVVGVFALLCGCVVPLFALIVSLPPEHGLRRATLTAFWLCGGVGLPLLSVAALGWTIWENQRSRQAARNLAEALGLPPLNNAPNLMKQWYGSQLEGRPFAIAPAVMLDRSYDGAHHRSSFRTTWYLRVALAVRVPQPLQVTAARTHADRGAATSLRDAFPSLVGVDRLPPRAQDALIRFVQSGGRNLRLLDRADASPALLPPEMLADATVVLIHDHPKPRALTPSQLQAALADMSEIAAVLEAAPA
jgi:hypothetical protein